MCAGEEGPERRETETRREVHVCCCRWCQREGCPLLCFVYHALGFVSPCVCFLCENECIYMLKWKSSSIFTPSHQWILVDIVTDSPLMYKTWCSNRMFSFMSPPSTTFCLHTCFSFPKLDVAVEIV